MKVFWLLLAAITATVTPSIGESEKMEDRLLPQGETLLSTPDGLAIAEIQRESRGKVLQRQGDWLRLQLEGYIWRPSVEKIVPKPVVTEGLPPIPVQLAEYSIRWFPQDLKRRDKTKRAHVVAQFVFQNNTVSEIACLSYRVQLYNLQGQTLHQETFSCESGDTQSTTVSYTQEILWKEYNGKLGEVYRRLKKAARQRTVKIDLTLEEAFFQDGTQTRFEF